MRRGAFVYFALVLALVALAFVLWKDTNCSPSVVNAGNRRDVDVAGLVPDRPNEDREAEDKLPVSLETKTAATNPTIKAHIVKQKQPKPKPKPKWNVFTTSEKYTIVVMTYKRDDLLKRFLIHYNQKSFPQLEKIVVIWNNIGVPLNEKEFIPNIPSAAPITFIVAKTNTLRNKMTPHPEVTTNAVLMMDDDLLIPGPDMAFAFRTWKQFPQRIVGFIARKHVYEPDGTISYGDFNWERGVPNSYSLILTCACMVHREYINMFDEAVPPEIHNMIDKLLDCDDLTFNIMVGDYLKRLGMPQTPGLLVGKARVQYIAGQARSGFRGLSELPYHRKQRFGCLKKLNATYNGLPLPFSDTMALKIA